MAPSRQIKSCSDTSGLNGHCADRECAVCNLVTLHLSAAIGEQLRQLGDVGGVAIEGTQISSGKVKVPKGADAAERFAADLAKMAEGKPLAGPPKRRLRLARFGLAAHFRGDTVCATFPTDWTFQDTLESSVWDLVAARVVVGTLIEVRSDNLLWWGLLIVVSATQGKIEVRELFHRDLEPAASLGETRGAYKIEYRGVVDKWVVIRLVDGREWRATSRQLKKRGAGSDS